MNPTRTDNSLWLWAVLALTMAVDAAWNVVIRDWPWATTATITMVVCWKLAYAAKTGTMLAPAYALLQVGNVAFMTALLIGGVN